MYRQLERYEADRAMRKKLMGRFECRELKVEDLQVDMSAVHDITETLFQRQLVLNREKAAAAVQKEAEEKKSSEEEEGPEGPFPAKQVRSQPGPKLHRFVNVRCLSARARCQSRLCQSRPCQNRAPRRQPD